MLPMPRANAAWKVIKSYFEKLRSDNKFTLFAFSEVSVHASLSQACKKFQGVHLFFEDYSPVELHLKFLQQFHSQSPFYQLKNLDQQFAALWCDTEGKWLPKEFCILHYLAYANYFLGSNNPPVAPKDFKIKTFKCDDESSIRFDTLPLPEYSKKIFRSENPFYRHATYPKARSEYCLNLGEDQLNENGVMCARDGDMIRLMREWTRIFLEPSLQITSTVQWLQNNIGAVKNKLIQDSLEKALFQPGLLSEKIHNLPEIIPIFKALIKEGMEFYADQMQPKLFFIRLAILLESFQTPVDLDLLKKYEVELFSMLKEEKNRDLVYSHLLFLYQFALPSDDLSLQYMLEATFCLAYHHPREDRMLPPWVKIETAYTCDLWTDRVHNFFKNPEALKKLAHEIFNFLNLPHNEEMQVSAQYPSFKYGDYVIDIQKTAIFQENATLVPIPKDLTPYFPLGQLHIWLVDGNYFFGNRRIKYSANSQFILSKQFSTEFGTFWYKEITLQGIGNLIFFKDLNAWECSDTCSQKHVLLTKCDSEEPRVLSVNGNKVRKPDSNDPPYAVLLLSEELYEIWKLDDKGQRVGLKLVQHDLPFFQRLGLEFSTISWFDSAKNRITLLQIPHLSLEFEEMFVEGRWRMECKEFPGYLLADTQQLAVLNDFAGALVLEKEKQKIILLASNAVFWKQQSDFSATVEVRPLTDKSAKLSIYILEPDALYLKSSDPQANMQLTLLFAFQRDYVKALHYLEYAKKFKDYLLSYIPHFMELEDHSPEGLAFLLRVGIFFIEQCRQFNHEGSAISESCYFDLAKFYQNYLSVLSSHAASRIPKEVRLLANEELFLLNSLKPMLIAADEKDKKKNSLFTLFHQRWLPIFEIREHLLNGNGKYHAQIDWQFYSYTRIVENLWKINFVQDIYPEPVFNKFIVMDVHSYLFVRFTRENIATYFPLLFERAKQGNGQLDIFYLVQSQTRLLIGYASLLQYVSYYPKEFASIHFCQDPIANKKIFELIIQKASSVYALLKMKVSQLKDEKGIVLFQYDNTTRLSLEKTYPNMQTGEHFSYSKDSREYFKDLRYEAFNIFLKDHLTVHTLPQIEAQPSSFPLIQKNEQKLLKELKKGYAQLCSTQYGKSHFSLQHSTTLERCLSQAKALLIQYEEKIQSVKHDAETAANWIPREAYTFNLRQRGRDLPPITMENILTHTYLTGDHSLLKAANPTLADTDIQYCVTMTITYHLYCIIRRQLQLGIEALEKRKNVQEFGQAMAIYGQDLDPTLEPEIFIYQSLTGKTLRTEQAHLFDWYCKQTLSINEKQPTKSLFAFPPGGGKTTLFHTIAVQRYQRLDYFPISISSAPLYSVDRQGQKLSLKEIFNLDLVAWDLTLNSYNSAEDFKQIYDELVRYGTSKVLKITPQVFYTLHLRYQLALEKEDREEVLALSHILFDIFQDKAAALADECRITFSPKTEAKIGIGKPQALPTQDCAVFLQIYRALFAFENMLMLSKNLHATVGSTVQIQVKELACAYLLEELSFFTILKEQKQSVLDYWIKGGNEPEWLSAHFQAREIDVVKIYFDVFYEDAMKLICNMGHRLSARNGEDIHVPARRQQPTSGYFKEHYLALIATIHGLLQQGLNEDQTEKLIEKMQTLHCKEVGNSSKTSKAEEVFQQCMQNTEQRLLNHRYNAHTHQLMHKHPEAIFFFLEHIALAQITYSQEQLNASPIHFAHAFRKIDFCSANPSQKQIYSIFGDSYTDEIFLAHAIAELSNAKNSQLLIFPVLNEPLDFFVWLYDNHPQHFEHLGMVTDAGGMLRNFSSKEIAQAFLIFLQQYPLDFDGIIFFEETAREEEGRLFLKLKNGKEHDLTGNDIVESLAQLGYQWEKLKLLTLINPPHATGANCKQRAQSGALLLIGEELGFGDLAQGATRLRELFQDQFIIWCIPEELAKQIQPQGGLTPLEILQWSVENEEKKEINELKISALQQIEYIIQEPIWQDLKKQLKDPSKQIKIWKKQRAGFVQKEDNDLIKRFKGPTIKRTTREQLLTYAEALYKRFVFNVEWKKATSVHAKIEPVIKMLEERVKFLETRALSLQQECLLHTHKHVEKDQVKIATSDLTPVKQDKLHLFQFDSTFFLTGLLTHCYSAQSIFKSKHLTSTLYFTKNLLNTARTGRTYLMENYLKPAQYLLIIQDGFLPNCPWYAFALSDEEAVYFQNQLSKYTPTSKKMALICANGNPASKGNFTSADYSSVFVKNVTLELGLTRCELTDAELFKKRLQNWDDFLPMWERIKQCQPYDQITIGEIERLIIQNNLR